MLFIAVLYLYSISGDKTNGGNEISMVSNETKQNESKLAHAEHKPLQVNQPELKENHKLSTTLSKANSNASDSVVNSNQETLYKDGLYKHLNITDTDGSIKQANQTAYQQG